VPRTSGSPEKASSPSPDPITALLPRCRFPATSEVTCAVSGGADSLALLVLACAAVPKVTAIHVDHGLRPGSADEANVVRDAAMRFRATFETRRVCVTPGPNLEARARAARYEALPIDVLTGHTADDQAETMLLNLMRGSGLDGMAGMRPDRRPLLGLRRRETHGLCQQLRLQPVADPTNADPIHRRNRVRHELLPLLDAIAERDMAALLAREATLVRDEGDLLDALAAQLDPCDAKAVAAAPIPLARRALRRWLADPYPPTAADIERVLAVARGDAVATEIQGGRRIARQGQRLHLR
jgi:tRNA(Ile)-lysidine synthase